MIVVIKGKKEKQLIIKALSMLSLVFMFWLYYDHMSDKFKAQNDQLVSKLELKKEKKKTDKTDKLEQTIYKEAVVIVNLLDQKHIQSIKIVKNRLFIICDFTTDIEPIMIRYGVNAMIKNSSKNIKLALDLKIIVENKYES
ncbi:MAG: hypothetical protein DRG78_03025 [Epsilonproteobacteria bacterium]|nr:MAG: hypothetical protein DRG78_03025 [Campylobacterota bacterium]